VLLNVGLVNPLQTVHKQIIQCRRNGAQDCHQKEGNLQHGLGEEVQSIDKLIVPCLVIEIYEQGEDEEEGLDDVDRDVDEDSDSETSAHSDCSLTIMVRGEDLGILQSTMGCLELSTCP